MKIQTSYILNGVNPAPIQDNEKHIAQYAEWEKDLVYSG